MHSDEDIDVGVAILAGAVVTTWRVMNLPQYPLPVNPIPDAVLNQILYVLDIGTAAEVKYSLEDLYVTRTGEILDRAYDYLATLGIEPFISNVPLYNGAETLDYFIICLDDVIVFDTVFDTARWKAAGIWKINHP